MMLLQGDRRKLLDNDNDRDGEVRGCLRQCVHSGNLVVAQVIYIPASCP